MNRSARWLGFLELLCVIVISVATAGAAEPAPSSAAGARPRQPLAGAPPRMSLALAEKALTAAQSAAAAAGVHVAIAVVDANGDLVDFVRLDGAPSLAVTTSQGKARAAVLFGLPTKAVQDAIAAGQPIQARLTAPPLGANELTPFQGGVPIFDDGKLIAAIGVGGSAPRWMSASPKRAPTPSAGVKYCSGIATPTREPLVPGVARTVTRALF